jgi:hypothetical protein
VNIPFFLKLQSFQSLKTGWSYGEGGPISPAIIARASQLIIQLISRGLEKIDVFPGLSGEVAVAVYNGDDYLEFILESDQSITFARETNGEEISYEEGMNLVQAIGKINQYKEKENKCATSGCFTNNITIRRAEGSPVWRSGLLATVESLSSVKNARKKRVGLSAGISSISTPPFPGRQLCTGSSGPISFHSNA